MHMDRARIDAPSGRRDQARERLHPIFAADRNHLEALLYTSVSKRSRSTKLLRITVGRGLAVQDSPAVRLALAELTQQE
jgi:hypothetical protein